jgi:hypothetical protein
MDLEIAYKLENNKDWAKKLSTLVSEYVKQGTDAVSYWSGEFDCAHDMLMAYAPLSKKDFEKLEKGHPRRFTLPMTATQLTTMTTFIAQMLFGQETPHKVEGRTAEDEPAAEHLNNLLRWNAEQQQTYLLGYLWIQDALTFNRGTFYNSWAPIYKPVLVPEEATDPAHPFVPPSETNPTPTPPTKFTRFRRKNQVIGGYCKMDLVSPYDFFSDPTFPMWRMQEMRYCGHKFKISWQDLERRSKLDPSHPSFVLPSAVAALKEKKPQNQTSLAPAASSTGSTSSRPDAMMSRSQYERMRTSSPLGSDKVNEKDPGILDCHELWVRLVPKDYELYDGDEQSESTIFQFIIANGDTILAVNESTYAHGQFPYSLGEGRPSGHYQFSPGWAFMLKGIQDYVDWLKNRHQEALARTVGNVFIANPTKVDLDDFLDPEKEGLIIPLKPGAGDMKISDVIQQVPIKDLTERFHEEMMQFVSFSETVTGANASMQGAMGEDDPSATQYAGTQQMSAGRMASVARLLSVQGLVPQTKQFVSNYQQFLSMPQAIRYMPTRLDVPLEFRNQRSIVVSPDTIQGEFDFIPHDGTLPGTDTKRVAALTRLLESASAFPQLFVPAPGNLDPRQIVFAAAKASDLNPENFYYTPESIAELVAAQVQNQAGVLPQVQPGGGPPPEAVAPQPMAQPPGPAPAVPTLPNVSDIGMPTAAPPQIRPGNM